MFEPQLIIVDKPAGITSHDIVADIRRDLRPLTSEKILVGHAGTLDPFATGLLIILVGKAVKAQDFFLHSQKTYEATIQLGTATDTGDLTGTTTETAPTPKLEKIKIEEELTQLIGTSVQPVPLYAAAKVDGKKLYEYARAGIEPPRRPIRVIQIHKLDLLSVDQQQKQITIRVQCGSGTYIRALAEQIAHRLQTVGHLVALRRVQSGDFTIDDAIA